MTSRQAKAEAYRPSLATQGLRVTERVGRYNLSRSFVGKYTCGGMGMVSRRRE